MNKQEIHDGFIIYLVRYKHGLDLQGKRDRKFTWSNFDDELDKFYNYIKEFESNLSKEHYLYQKVSDLKSFVEKYLNEQRTKRENLELKIKEIFSDFEKLKSGEEDAN